ncbi:hypothetical protein MPLDJ20_20079 [Mesorhizobium plurifarium]|uniref:MucR family transcriptional regulator n=1 Tax=Mesorhizobium plurifarium TaxID=69974 RepID=A0A090F0H2_MESPL|nr:hypothetical protein MPLDJ20_20079 [Mesorhizobium plurifarium]
MEETDDNTSAVIELTAEVVSAYVSNNPVPVGDLPALIDRVHGALKSAGSGAAEKPEALTPAVPIRKSVTPDYIISLEDGKKFKSLKRHLSFTMASRRMNTAPNGACRLTIRWWPRITPPHVLRLPSQWDLAARLPDKPKRRSPRETRKLPEGMRACQH